VDPELVGEVLSVISDLAVEGWTLVIVTHEIQFARQVSDQCCSPTTASSSRRDHPPR
jgi:ABC-type histidine transport system ATPase subunit